MELINHFLLLFKNIPKFLYCQNTNKYQHFFEGIFSFKKKNCHLSIKLLSLKVGQSLSSFFNNMRILINFKIVYMKWLTFVKRNDIT